MLSLILTDIMNTLYILICATITLAALVCLVLLASAIIDHFTDL